MLVKIEDLIREGLIDPAYTQILSYELNDLSNVAHTRPDLTCRESEIVLGLGLLKSKDMIDFINNKTDNGIEYKLKRDKSDINPISVVDIVQTTSDSNRLTEIFTTLGMFPYHIDESGCLEWAVKENEFDSDWYDIMTLNANKVTRSLGLDNVRTHDFRFLLSNQYNTEFKNFCLENKLSFDPKSVHNPSIPHIASCYIIKGILMGASDIYFDPKPNGIHINYKILNDYIRDDRLLLSEPETKSFIDEIMVKSGQEGKARTRSQEVVDDVSIVDLGGFGHKYFGRVNLFRNMTKDAVCIRIVDKGKKAIPMVKSIINPKRKSMLCQILMNEQGIFLICGSTGSGKSTTLGTCEGYMAEQRPYDRIETVEKPIEQEVEEVSQISLENSTATYDDVAQAFTRRNPDIIVLGEMNTAKTVRFGIDIAQQNKFLLSTLHTSSAAKAPDRIRSMTISDPSAFDQFLSELRALMHQTMLKECCPHCTKKIDIDDPRITEDMHVMLKYYGYYNRGTVAVTEPNPECKVCEGRGFLISKPVICVELCPIDDSLREDLKECHPAKIETLLEAYMIDNHLTSVQDALEYMESGKLDWMQIWTKFALFQKVSKAKPLVNKTNVSQSTSRIME